MNEIEDRLARLRASIDAGKDRFRKDRSLAPSYTDEIVIPLLKEVLEFLFVEIEERHSLTDTKGDQYVYVIHYTGISNLVSMLRGALENKKKSSLRLYDSVHFNDPDEGNYFDRSLSLSKGHNLLKVDKALHAYITSFVLPHPRKDMSDNLVFWRMYGREGTGCSLRLRVPRKRLQKVLYGVNKVKRTDELLQHSLDTLYPIVNGLGPTMTQVREALLTTITGHIESIRYLFKSDAYDYERECRMVVPETKAIRDAICFEYEDQSDSIGLIRHYYEDEDLEVRSILATGSAITLGPRVAYPDNVHYYLQSLLRKLGLGGQEFRTSRIPYQKP